MDRRRLTRARATASAVASRHSDGAPAQARHLAHLQRILGSDDIASVCEATLATVRAGGQRPTHIAYSVEWPRKITFQPPLDAAPALLADIEAGVLASRAGQHPTGVSVLCDDGHEIVAVLLGSASTVRAPADPGDCSDVLAASGRRLRELLTIEGLHASIARLAEAEELQHALFAIADLAGSGLDMPELLRGLHRIVGSLMYAENLYIALHDLERGTVRFLYYVDALDTTAPSTDSEFCMSQFTHSLTWYLLSTGRALMGSPEELTDQVPGPLSIVGLPPLDYLGVPMIRDGRVLGALVVQTYVDGLRFTPVEKALLAFVAEHVLTALDRKQGQEELERRVLSRTRELAAANEKLSREVAERERGEQLQAALYQIAALANTDRGAQDFFAELHAIIGRLLNAENIYVALLADEGRRLEFPYSVDPHDVSRPARPLGWGLTEYVIRTSRPQILSRARIHDLVDEGEVAAVVLESPTVCWLGAPLIGADDMLGVVAVQSYDDGVGYTERDAELLTFVCSQIASSLQRRKAAEDLRLLNGNLERRVVERTRQLSEQITVREEVEAQLKHQVMHDPLTGLPNRVYVRERLTLALAALKRRPEQGFALLYLDVDRFKIFNDSLGHLAGDEILREVSRRLRSCIREPDIAARLSGDEFAILLEHSTLPETALAVAQRLQQALEQPFRLSGREVQMSASIGIAIGAARHADIDEILHDADKALYRAKSAGRQRAVLFDDSLKDSPLDVLDVEQQLRLGLQRDEFEPYFQPFVRLDDGACIGYEALIRWNHPQRGLVAPADFLPVAEDSGLIERIDWRMYRLALLAGAPLVRDGGFITLNISPRHFQTEDFDERLLALTRETRFDPARLRIEVTEGTLLADPNAVAAILARLRASLVEAALDDFGTGYSSLGYVNRFPLKMIKVDRSFVDPLGGEHAKRGTAIICAILALARSLGLEVVAEGVETQAQRHALIEMGCVYAQGYLFGHPLPAKDWHEPPAPPETGVGP